MLIYIKMEIKEILPFNPKQASENISQIFNAKETQSEINKRIEAEVMGGIDFS